VGLNVFNDVDLPDHAPGVDEVRDPPRRSRGALVGAANDIVGCAHVAGRVREQWERRLKPLGEGSVLLRCIEGDAKYRGAGGLELGGSVTEPLDLDPSPGCVGLDEPPQHQAASPKFGERDSSSRVVR
jgi:hypothetical protein